MKLSTLIKDLDIIDVRGDLNTEILDVTIDSNSVFKGSLFICIKGDVKDGHDYTKQAFHYGAVAIVSEKETGAPLPQIIVKNSRIAMSKIASAFYGDVHKNLKIIGVTGTNGKTTTSFMIRSILEKSGVKSGLIGTLGTFYADKVIEPSLTTPDPLTLHKLFADMLKDGVKVAVMEVSAHALKLNKVEGINFEIAVFTNFSQDHLDYFKDMEEYKKAKLKLFNENRANYYVVNSDDSVGRELLSNEKTISYGLDNPADVFAIELKEKSDATQFILNLFDEIYKINIPYIGKFNVENALASSTACALLGIKTDAIAKNLNKLNRVDGRLELVYKKDFSVFVDYAHTPDGLEKTLKSLRKICEKKVICLFGCGGNRDKGKRKIMGEISGRNADFTIVTSDNPRFEDPMDIISEREEGVLTASKNYVAIEDRKQAIKYALNLAKSGDVVLIAGKGSEKHQEILGIKHKFCDKDIVIEILKGDGLY